MQTPNFNLHSVINKQLRGVTLSYHTVNNCLMPADVRKQVEAGRRIWTMGSYNHAVNVNVAGYGAFDLRWNNDSMAVESINRRWLAQQVYFFKMRNQVEQEKAA